MESDTENPEVITSDGDFKVTWESLGVTEEIVRALKANGIVEPTAIQRLSIPLALRDRKDILGAAATGSGKTLAFGIPLVQLIEESNRAKIKKKLKALVITPTRELAQQIKRHLDVIIKHTTVTVGCVFGGLSTVKQERILNKLQPDILVATPGRLWELVNELEVDHVCPDNIGDIKYLVVDEADRMTEKGHFEELRNLVGMIRERSKRTDRQTFVFSATLTFCHKPPDRSGKKRRKMVAQTPKKKLHALAKLLGMKKDMKVIDLTKSGVGVPDNDQLIAYKVHCAFNLKDVHLYYFLLANPGKTLVFCNSKDCLRRLHSVLKILGINPIALHAGMEQKRRLVNLERFTKNDQSVLIASDVAARGLDIAKIDHVVHYQVPRTAETYIHRSGRTARCFNKGLSLVLCCREEEKLYYKLCKVTNEGKDLQSYPVDPLILHRLKSRVDLASQIDKLTHEVSKKKANENFFRRMAKECDIDIDDRDDLIREEDHGPRKKSIKILEKQLNKMLKKKISFPKKEKVNHREAYESK